MSAAVEPNYIDEPNKVAEVYRNYRPTVVPFEVEKRLDFMDISKDGFTILGSSSLSGRYWRGSVWYFKNAQLAPQKDKSDTGIECESSVSDGKFLDNKNLIIVGEDSGAVTIYELVKDDDQTALFEGKNCRSDHDSSVLTISVSNTKTNVITSGMDMCIKVWDIKDLIPTYTFRCAHSHHVTAVTYSASSSDCFASCGLDGAALLWDTRQSKPATVLVDDSTEGLTALAWQTGDENTLAVGSSFGNLSLIDVRSCAVLNKSTPYDRTIYKLLSIESSLLAVCADSHEVKVIDPTSDNLEIKYVDERHRDFVRGLSYDEKSGLLYSCGWDKQVLAHRLRP